MRLLSIVAALGYLAATQSVVAHAQTAAAPLIVRRESLRRSAPATPVITLSAENHRRNALLGGLVGSLTGAAIGYGLAILAHQAFCEGSQCDQQPNRAIRESARAGVVIGGSIGAIVGWRWR